MAKSKSNKDNISSEEVNSLAKGYNGRSLANDLFSQVNDIFYEFGLLKRPEQKNIPEKSKNTNPDEEEPEYYYEEDVLLNKDTNK